MHRKLVVLLSIMLFLFSTVSGQSSKRAIGTPDPSKKTQVVEIACGHCRFHMKSKGCSLAVRLEGNTYLVDGADIDDFGDAHDDDGFCNAVRKAEVQGAIVNNRFKATYIKILPAAK